MGRNLWSVTKHDLVALPIGRHTIKLGDKEQTRDRRLANWRPNEVCKKFERYVKVNTRRVSLLGSFRTNRSPSEAPSPLSSPASFSLLIRAFLTFLRVPAIACKTVDRSLFTLTAILSKISNFLFSFFFSIWVYAFFFK